MEKILNLFSIASDFQKLRRISVSNVCHFLTYFLTFRISFESEQDSASFYHTE